MKLKIFIPSEILLEDDMDKMTAEGVSGSFGIRPNHIDIVEMLEPGILSYIKTENGEERFVAVDWGVLVKQKDEVRISVTNAVSGESLGSLRKSVAEEFLKLDETEKKSRSALARLEADFIRRFLQQQSEIP
ncbi:MAG: F0F1 ATP synthase subunit epsilon [Calditrichaeota bacterium]|nr:F0F1 ATP synthase subunit epsilon [Calditrichota bacterium]RQW04907.1 MAG: F0F1 ATP synthase subunit epsilon [Calditrichota bacterium]